MTYSQQEISCDVAIIGCGPVGAVAANLLGRQGLKVVVIEKQVTHYPQPRAVHIDHEMMRLFQSAGVIQRVKPDMAETDGHLHIGADGGVIRYMGTVGAPRPFGWANDYFFYQPELESHLRAALLQNDAVSLILGAEFTNIAQDDNGVTINYTANNEKCQVRARWMIATDGAHSPVRKSLGVELDDLNFEEPWLVVDAEVEGPLNFPEFEGLPGSADLQRLSVMMCDPSRPTTLVPGRRNHRRWEFMLLPDEDDTEMMREDNVAQLIKPWLKDNNYKILRASTYRFHALVAKQWQVGRVFIAGDAAHQTPPFFGQGMCHGFRDVANLAWKMAAIVNEGVDASILSTYQLEREDHVRGVIGAAVAAGRYICELDPNKAAQRDATFRDQAAHRRGETAADLIPPIREGLILGGTPSAGDRFIQPQLSDGRMLDDFTGQGWRLIVLPDHAVSLDSIPTSSITAVSADDLPDKGAVRKWLEDRSAEAVLIRPDHYVFGTGKAFDLIAACNAQVFQGREALKCH